MLWPLLLAPLTLTRWAVGGTLLLNVMFGVVTAWLIGAAVADWPGEARSRDERIRRGVSVVALIFIANMVGLTFIGMEHMLQTMLALACAMGIVACLRGREIPSWCIAAAVVSPWVRYESLCLTVGLGIALWGLGRRRAALWTMVAAVAPLVLFSMYLHGVGLPWMPTSVMVKGGVTGQNGGALIGILAEWVRTMLLGFTEPERGPLIVLWLSLCRLAWTAREQMRRFAFGGAAAATGLHLLLGRYGWFYRYEVYAVAFAAVVVLYAVHERPRMMFGWYALGLLFCGMPYVRAAVQVRRASHEIYRQQYQTSRLAHEFYKGNVAVDDLGLVSFDRPQGQYVLDLFGLGSVEASRQRDKSAAWLDSITRRHEVGLVAIYPYYKQIPESWRPLGSLCVTGQLVILAEPCVSYYATGVTPVVEAEQAFGDFVKTLPVDVAVER